MQSALDEPKNFASFLDLVRRLRKECPWDREQTPESMRMAMIEEVYEAVDAIDDQDWSGLAGELGDVLLNVVFQAVLAEELGRFDMHEVITRESNKLIFRHPHVFGDTEVKDSTEVLMNWEQLKTKETKRESVLDGVPRQLPALLYAERVQQKVARVGFDFPSLEEAWDKVDEETMELKATDPADKENWTEEFGDLLFSLVNIGRRSGISPETALRQANQKFKRRFQFIEAKLAEAGSSTSEATLEEMDRYWDLAKGEE